MQCLLTVYPHLYQICLNSLVFNSGCKVDAATNHLCRCTWEEGISKIRQWHGSGRAKSNISCLKIIFLYPDFSSVICCYSEVEVQRVEVVASGSSICELSSRPLLTRARLNFLFLLPQLRKDSNDPHKVCNKEFFKKAKILILLVKAFILF